MADQDMQRQFEETYAAQFQVPTEHISSFWNEAEEKYDAIDIEAAWGAWQEAIAATESRFIEIIGLLQEWHQQRIDKLLMVRDASPEIALVLQGKEGEPLTLDGKEAAAFKAAVHMSLELFQKFPITVTKVLKDAAAA